jgi:hypothetical protein
MGYCLGDSQMTNLIILAIDKAGRIQLLTHRRRISSEPMPRSESTKRHGGRLWMGTI